MERGSTNRRARKGVRVRTALVQQRSDTAGTEPTPRCDTIGVHAVAGGAERDKRCFLSVRDEDREAFLGTPYTNKRGQAKGVKSGRYKTRRGGCEVAPPSSATPTLRVVFTVRGTQKPKNGSVIHLPRRGVLKIVYSYT